MSSPPFDEAALREICAIMTPAAEALLVGEHHNRPDFPPTLIASVLLEGGATPWMTLACRDRNRVVLEQELRGLLHIGVDTVLCVTGDGRGPDVRPDVTQVFDLDGPRLAGLATHIGLCAAVPESPLAPPAALRAARLVEQAGRRCGGRRAEPPAGRGGRRRVRAHGPRPRPDDPRPRRRRGVHRRRLGRRARQPARAAAGRRRRVPSGTARPIPVAAGIDEAVEQALQLLAIDGVEGVNVSGLGSARGWQFAAEVKARVGARILEIVPARERVDL